MLRNPLTEASLTHLDEELNNAVDTAQGKMGSPLFNDLSKMIKDTMTPAILTAHSGAVSQLDDFRRAFETCGTPDLPSAGSFGGVTNGAIADRLEEHRQCRAKEDAAIVGANTCNTNLKKEETVKDGACKAVPGSDGTPPALDKDGHVGCKVTDGDYEGWLNSFDHQVEQLHKQLEDATAGCGNASKVVDDMIPQCQAADGAAAANKTACNAIQVQADTMGCLANPVAHEECQTYSKCYIEARDNYLAANESIAEAQANRTLQWRVMKRMQCLLETEEAGATHDAIDACREATIDTSHLDLDYPDIPEEVDCSHIVGGALPCTDEWTAGYGQMPANAPAAPCTRCPGDLVNTVQYGRYDYATLDDHPVDDPGDGGCQSVALPLPPNGWKVAPNTADVKNVVWQHNWGTQCLSLKDGSSWLTKIWRKGKVYPCGNGFLREDANGYYPGVCPRRILIRRLRKEMLFQPTQVVIDGQYEYATLDNHRVDDAVLGCQEVAFPVPKGWQIASNTKASEQVVYKHRWGTHCLTFSDGLSFNTAGRGATGCGVATLVHNGIGYLPSGCWRRILISRLRVAPVAS